MRRWRRSWTRPTASPTPRLRAGLPRNRGSLPAPTNTTCSPAPLSKKATAKAKNPQQLHPNDARQIQPVAVVQPVVVAKAPVPTVLKVQVTVPAEFQDVIATETYNNDPVLVAPKGGTNPKPFVQVPSRAGARPVRWRSSPDGGRTAAATGAGQELAHHPVRTNDCGTFPTSDLYVNDLYATSNGSYPGAGGWEHGAPVRAGAQGHWE